MLNEGEGIESRLPFKIFFTLRIASLSDNDGTTLKEQYILGPSFSTSPPGTDILDFPEKINIDLECNEQESKMRQRVKWLVSLIKLSEAEPYAPGIGNDILGPRYVFNVFICLILSL